MGEKKMDKLITFEQLQELVGIPRSTLYYQIALGKIPSVKMGRHRRFIVEDVLKALRKLS